MVLIPDAPKNLLNTPTITNAARIGFSWSDGDSTGGESIMYYTVYYDQSNNDWIVLAPAITDKFYTTTVTLVKGRLY